MVPGIRAADLPKPAFMPLPSPENLDRPLRVSTSMAGLGLGVLLAAIAAAVVWSCVSAVPVKVTAQGILLSRLGVADVTANAGGRVVALRVAIGDRVQTGQIVAELSEPDLQDKLQTKLIERQSLESARVLLGQVQARTLAASMRERDVQRQALEVRSQSLADRLATLREIERNTASLLASGFETRTKLLGAVNDRSRTQTELNDTRSQLLTLQSQDEQERSRNERDMLQADLGVIAADRDIAVIRDDIARKEMVRAEVDGTVIELTVNEGEQVPAGVPLARVLRGSGQGTDMQVLVFIPDARGKRVRPGMEAQVVPATARLQRDGFLVGRVESIAELPSTRESMLRALKNSTYVDQLMHAGPPYQATLSLERDPASPSGLRWSAGRGPAEPIQVGTLAEAKIVVDHLPVIGLVIPRAETVLTWLHRE